MDVNVNDQKQLKFKSRISIKSIISVSNYYWSIIYLIIYILCFVLIFQQCQSQSSHFSLSILTSSDRSKQLTKMLVIYHVKEDLDWIDLQIGMEIPHIIYTHLNDSLILHRISNNKGREATAYLQYIIDYYSKLPSLIAFLPAYRTSPYRKNQSDIVVALRALQWNKYIYMPLNSLIIEATFKPNTGNEQTTVNYELWRDVLQDELGPPPEKSIKTHCCATFVVKREAILAHSKHFYSRIFDYIASNRSSDVAKATTLEYAWHIIFGQPANINYKTCDIFVCDSNGTISVKLAEKVL